ncbi:MAG: secondary thiamine-phosphate synthase enzyme YjbQ [Candidatus Methanofastidiosia archaeon]
MKVYNKKIVLPATREIDVLDITANVQAEIDRSGIITGLANIFVVGSTAAVTTMEFEPGLVKDTHDAFKRLFPESIEYEHHKRWHDGNGHSHIRAAFMGPSLTAPVRKGRLALGIWQQIVYIELDNKTRNREIVITVIGE